RIERGEKSEVVGKRFGSFAPVVAIFGITGAAGGFETRDSALIVGEDRAKDFLAGDLLPIPSRDALADFAKVVARPGNFSREFPVVQACRVTLGEGVADLSQQWQHVPG